MKFLSRYLDELLTALFWLGLLTLSVVRGSPLFEPLEDSGLAFKTVQWATLVIVLLLIFSPREFFTGVKNFIIVILALMCYEGMKHMHATALTLWLGISPKDDLMMALDIAIFGKTPYLWFMDWGLDSTLSVAVLGLFYSSYYFGPIAALGYAQLSGNDFLFRLIRRGIVIGLYGGYCFYILIPVAGPTSQAANLDGLFFEKIPAFQSAYQNLRYSFDCFPSLHTAIPWVIVLLCWQQLPAALKAVAVIFSIGCTLSTVGLRFHYGIDVIAGMAWAMSTAFLARKSMRHYQLATNH
jgi:membrane-associated phospholipid phosphatase